jgi:hypothetical protein
MKRHPTIDETLIAATLKGIHRWKNVLFRINPLTGEHSQINSTGELRKIGCSYADIRLLFQTYPFPELEYKSKRMKAIAAGKRRRHGPAPKVVRLILDEDKDVEEIPEDEEDAPLFKTAEDEEVATCEDSPWAMERERVANAKVVSAKAKQRQRYSLVTTSNGLYGSYDGKDGSLVLFKVRSQAEDYIDEQLNGVSVFREFYGGKMRQD